MCANVAAHEAGIQCGATLTDAQAICPDLLTEPRDRIREGKLLAALHIWADKYSPRISLDPPDGLVLDITGCAHLFEGEREMAERIIREATDLNMTPRIGIANTRHAARGFAKQGGSDITISAAEREPEQVAKLTIEALELEQSVVDTLSRLGVKTIGDLRRFKTAELARRFSACLPTALDELRGHRADPIIPHAAPPTFAARMTLPDPIARVDDVTAILKRLAERVCARLDEKGYAARGFELTVRCVDTGDHHRSIGFATPSRDSASILRQFQRPLETIKLEFGADQFRLEALDAEIFRHTQLKAGDAMEAQQDAVDQTLTTLGNRLGFDRLYSPCAEPGHTPERENSFGPIVDQHPRKVEPDLTTYPRPEIVFPPQYIRIEAPGQPPKRFAWRGSTYDVSSAKGRERISPVPWDDPRTIFEAQTRDYWRARTACGRMFWLMTFAAPSELDWFICGEFLREPRLQLLHA